MSDDRNSGSATPEKAPKIPLPHQVVDTSPEKCEGRKSRTTTTKSGFSALQKWLQLGSNSESSHEVGKSSEMTKSLVKERVSAMTPAIKSVSSATQTSPEEMNLIPAPPAQFSIGSAGLSFGAGTVGGKSSPNKVERKHKPGRSRSGRRDRPKSPQQRLNNSFPPVVLSSAPVKTAMGPAHAQSIRAVFGAVLWNAGIIHDAMACASFLKFKQSNPAETLTEPTQIIEPIGSEIIVGTQSVIMRKKTRSPSKSQQQKHQRHSVEVTCTARYLKENPEMQIESFEITTTTTTTKPTETTTANEPTGDIEGNGVEQLPAAMAALESVWNYVKSSCAEALFKDSAAHALNVSSVGESKSTPVKMRKDHQSRRGTTTTTARSNNLDVKGKVVVKKERPRHLHAIGRSFLLETEESRDFAEEMQQCEICHVRFPPKGKSRSAHFGLSIMCENCTERHLKLKKQLQQDSLGKGLAAAVTAVSSADSEIRHLSPTAEVLPPQSTIMDNAFFLLQMINTVSDSYPQQPPVSSEVVSLKSTFTCCSALGVSESQLLDDDSPFCADEISPDGGRNSETTSYRDGWPGFGSHKRAVDLEDRSLVLKRALLGAPRQRKVSNGDPDEEPGYTLLNHPSVALQRILDAKTNLDSDAISKMCGGILNFVTERHDLDSVKLYLFQAIRGVACRSYGMQILAWLMRNVSQPIALHDLLWWYASTLEVKPEDDVVESETVDSGWWQMRTHPLAESPAMLFPILTESFQLLLQTISDVMPILPIGSPLLEMVVKCWGVCFSRKDHKFLHRSKIFRNLSQIMSQFDGDSSSRNNEWSKSSVEGSNPFHDPPPVAEVTVCLADLTGTVDLKVSSRGALCPSLTDGSTETFWESGEEDRSRAKTITLVSNSDIVVKVLAIHVDNIRDSQYKVSAITVKVGPHLDELSTVGHVEIDIRHCGWCWFPIECKTSKVFKLELKGPDNTLRARQIKVLGFHGNLAEAVDKVGLNVWIARRKCENETLRIFRLLSSEVFGKLLLHIKRGEEDGEANDLQEHVVGILFSRNKLTHLQKQVCSHIVGAIHREAMKIKEEFDSHTSGSILEATTDNVRMVLGEKPKIADRYCFEMLSLVLALSGSKTGRLYLSQQSNLVQNLMHLLHVGTPRIQRQVTSVLRKILPEIKPEDFARIIRPQESEEGTRIGILDMLLGCIVKSVQVKVRTSQDGNRSAKNISTSEIYSSEELPTEYWFLKGDGDIQLANTVVKLVKDMCEEPFSEEWVNVTKPAIAECVLFLTKIEVCGRRSEDCLISPKFWIALAALCVLHPDHSKLLSSPAFQNGGTGRAKCVNHDDGETLAVIHCNECHDLCAECDRFLHLPKKNWNHVRKVCKEEEESIKVDLHEGCGRIKLFWLMALADSSTLKALVEFRNEIPKAFSDSVTAVTTVGRCRFCNKVGNTGPLALGNVCGESECQEYSKTACERVLECGHLCGGVRNEMKCLPCLQGCSDKIGTGLKQDSDDMCMICFTDALAFAPAIQLLFGHVFHYHCVRTVLERRWAGPRITFSFSYCPICKMDICHPLLDDLLSDIRELFLDVQRKSLMRLEYEGLNNIEAITVAGGRYYNNPAGFAMDRYAYYVCYKCKKAYFGGEARCDVELATEFDPSELVCGGCSDVSQAQLCPRHGTDFLEYKCRYCCSVAVFFCFGTTHFCNGCHDDFQRITAMPKSQLPTCPAGPRATQLDGEECPLHVFHPPTGEELALGCGICRNAHTF